jgi:hypothetical protein
MRLFFYEGGRNAPKTYSKRENSVAFTDHSPFSSRIPADPVIAFTGAGGRAGVEIRGLHRIFCGEI